MDDKIRLVCILALAVLGMMYLFELDANLMDYDEGAIYLYQNMLVAHGLRPYVDFYYHQPFGLLFGFTDILAARLVIIIFLVFAAISTYYIGKRFGVGWFAVVFLLSSPMVMQFGRVYVGDIPSLATFCMALHAIVAKTDKKMLKVLLFGVSSALCIFLKVQMIIPIAVLFLYLFFVRRDFDYAVSFFVVFVCFALAFIRYPGFMDDAFLGNMTGYDFSRAMSYMMTSVLIFIYKSLFMVPFIVMGAVELFKKRKESDVMALSVVITAAVVTALLYGWLNFRHFMFLLPVMAVAAGIGLKKIDNMYFTVAVLLCCIMVPISEWKDTTANDQYTRDVVKNITSNTLVGDKIYTDQAMLAFLSNRTMPGSALLFNGMGRMHNLTASDVILDIKSGDPKLVIFVTQVYPDNKEGPRIYSTLGKDGAGTVMSYLDGTYPYKTYARRDWQILTVWSRFELK